MREYVKGIIMRTSKFLDEVMSKKGFKRDKQLAEWLDVTAAAVAQYRSGARTMDNEKCLKIALELEVEPMKVIMASDLDKAERAGQKSIWEVFMTRTQTVKSAGVSALLCLVFVTSALTTQEAKAAPALAFKGIENINALYYVKLMIKVLRNLLGKFRPTKRTIFSQFTAFTTTA
jgi:predicted transcriptional regulator